jgi:two-component system response regulator QseB
MRILIVEDDLTLGKLIRIALENQRYIVDWVIDDSEFFSAIKSTHYEIIILDINLPDKSGIEILKIMRSLKNHTPVLILTALNSAMQKVNGLDAGADDYLTKPFDLSELLARIRSLTRRSRSVIAENILTLRNLELDSSKHQVFLDKKIIELSVKDFSILKLLLENCGKVISKNRLENLLYNWDESIESNTIEVHIHNIRKKIGHDFIKTIRSVGYQIS